MRTISFVRLAVFSSLATFICAAALSPDLAAAQYRSYVTPSELQQRLGRMERDVNQLLHQMHNAKPNHHNSHTAMPANAVEQMEIRFSEMEAQMSRLTGTLEEVNYRLQQLQKGYSSLEKDVDFRLQALEQVARQNAATPSIMPEVANSASAIHTKPAVVTQTTTTAAPIAPEVSLHTAATKGRNAKSQYNHAFSLLNKGKYSSAQKELESFIEQHSKHELIGNAYYWLGETHYVQQDYLRAADKFRQGFETAPKGPKAVDNLLKLGMSMAAMGRKKESCIILGRLKSDYADASAAIQQRTDQERSRLGCS